LGEGAQLSAAGAASFKQLTVCSSSDEDNALIVVPKLIHEEEVTACMALPESFPIALKWMVLPFGRERPFVGNQKGHRLL
jgi:hypothetical protein